MISREQLIEIRAAEQPEGAPRDAGYWVMSKADFPQVEQLRDSVGEYLMQTPARPSRLRLLFGLPIIKTKEEDPIRFVLWCEHCGQWLRWDETGVCQRCHQLIPGAAYGMGPLGEVKGV